jgi:hypothetical protein
MLEIKVNAVAAKASPEDMEPLFEGLSDAKSLVDRGAQTYSELGHSAGDPDNPKFSIAQYEVIAGEYQKVLEVLLDAGGQVNQVESGIGALLEAADGFNARAEAVDAVVREAVRKQEIAQNQGFKTGYLTEPLARARQLQEQAVSLSHNRRFLQGLKTLEAAENLASEAAKSAEGLPLKKQEAEAAILALETRIERVKELISRGRNIFDRVSGTYAESSWESIEGNGTRRKTASTGLWNPGLRSCYSFHGTAGLARSDGVAETGQ